LSRINDLEQLKSDVERGLTANGEKELTFLKNIARKKGWLVVDAVQEMHKK